MGWRRSGRWGGGVDVGDVVGVLVGGFGRVDAQLWDAILVSAHFGGAERILYLVGLS